jgi:2,3-dihydroxybenzoate-AMP ligase
MEQIREILVHIGLEHVELEPGTRLRADLGLDSSETTQLESQLAERLGTRVDLWDEHDYTLGELAELVAADANRVR